MLVLLFGLLLADPAEAAHSRALELLARGDAPGAEAAAREALSASSRFMPEQELTVAPDKRLLFEDAIARARASYRTRRARYLETLGRALENQKRFPEARKALGRSVGLRPKAALEVAMASHPDMAPREKVRLLVDAFFEPDADAPAIVRALLETDAFRRPQDLQALLDVERFHRKATSRPSAVAARVAALPDFRVVTDFGTLVPSEVFATGASLVTYFPAPGCNRCGEELDGLGRALAEELKSGRKVSAVVLVSEPDLDSTRRILRTLAMRIQVGRRDRLPEDWRPEGPAIQVVARRGRSHFEMSLDAEPRSNEVRREISEIFELLKREDVPATAVGVERKIDAVTTREGLKGEKGALTAYIEIARSLEAGPLPLGDLSDRIDRLTAQTRESGLPRDDALEILGRLQRLEGAGRAKAGALTALDRDTPKKILAAAQKADPSVEREAPREEGVYRVAVGRGRILLQRSFLQGKTLRHFNFILSAGTDSLDVAWVGVEPEAPRGAEISDVGVVFYFEKPDGSRGLRLVDEVDYEGFVYEGAPAHLAGGAIVEVASALVDDVPSAPVFFRRGTIRDRRFVPESSPLETGLTAFRQGKPREALAQFESAAREIDPVAPYDEVDLRYNLARSYEALGERKKAMDLLRSIGDATYQAFVEERLRAIETQK